MLHRRDYAVQPVFGRCQRLKCFSPLAMLCTSSQTRSFAAQAETIQLKPGGNINLSAFDCTPVTESQLLHRVCYNEAHHYLIAQIGSEYYDNCDVGPKTVDGLMDSNHGVAFYNQHIRAGHECTSDQRRRIGVAILGALEQ